MKTFIVGATGFVGANLAHKLAAEGEDEVHVLLRPSSKTWRLEPILEKLVVHRGDINDGPGLIQILSRARPQAVYHLAVYGAYPRQTDVAQMLQTAVFGTLNLLAAAHQAGAEIVVNIGSSSEYGVKSHPMKEDELLEPATGYGVAKAAQTLLCQEFSKEKKVPVITMRIFSAYGPYEEPGRLVPTVIQKALFGQPIPLANPKTARDFIYIDDVVAALLLAGRHPEFGGQIFNLGTGVQHTITEAVEIITKLAHSRSEPRWGEISSRDFDTGQWVADTAKLQSTLGFKPKYSLAEGLEKTIDWFRSNPQFHNFYE